MQVQLSATQLLPLEEKTHNVDSTQGPHTSARPCVLTHTHWHWFKTAVQRPKSPTESHTEHPSAFTLSM